MAQKKLLFSLVLILINVNPTVLASTGIEAKDEGKIWLQDLTKNAANLAFNEIKQKYLELQNMLSINDHSLSLNQIEDQILAPNRTLRIFVSSSMSIELLKSYLNEAKRYNAILIFNGLPGGSWQRFSKLITDITGGSDEGVAIQIDDEAFDHFGVKSVPSFVLNQEDGRWVGEDTPEAFDKVTGNIGIKGALDLFKAQGELNHIAKLMIVQARGVR